MAKKQHTISIFLLGMLLVSSFVAVSITHGNLLTIDNTKNNKIPLSEVNKITSNHINKAEMEEGSNFKSMGENNVTHDMAYLISNRYSDFARDVMVSSNYFYVVGSIQEANNSAYTDIFIQKINASGYVVWNFTYGQSGESEEARDICQSSEGSYIYVTGFADIDNSGLTNREIILLKLTNDGTLVWAKTWGTTDRSDEGEAVGMDNQFSGNNYGIYVVGRSHVYGHPENNDVVIVKFNINGDQQWNATYDGGYDDFAEDVHVSIIPSRKVITVAGATSNGSVYSGLLLRYNYDGSLNMSKTISNSEGDIVLHAFGLQFAEQDYFYVAGEIYMKQYGYTAVVYRFTSDELNSAGGVFFPDQTKESKAYGACHYGDYIIVTGYIINNDKDEFYWKIDENSFKTVFFGTFDSGREDIGYGVAKSSNFTIIAGTQGKPEDSTSYDYYWDIWSPDVDDDNLSNFWEIRNGTDLNNPDSDNDGLQDGAEVYTYFTNPLVNDTDSDKLLDGEEVNNYGTSPLSNDTDNDGLNDYDEIFVYHSNPTSTDTDNDGLSDHDEIFTYNTNITNNDTDIDGMPDGWEVRYGLDPTNSSDASGDADNDGLTNLQEYQNGSDPTVDEVPPTINAVWTDPNSPNNATDTVIYANVVDPNNVSAVYLIYNMSGEVHNVTMSFNSTSSYYYYSLGMLPAGTNVTYYIIAFDTFGNEKFSDVQSFIVGVSSGSNSNSGGSQTGETGSPFELSKVLPITLISLVLVIALAFVALRKRK